MEEMIKQLAQEGYIVKIRMSDGIYLVSVHEKKTVIAWGESLILGEAIEDAFSNTPAREKASAE